MRTVFTILGIFLAQCTYLHAEPKEGFGVPSIMDSCIFGVKYISVYLYNSDVQGEKIAMNETCDKIDPSLPVAFVVHGFISSSNSSNFRELAMLLAQKGYTVFALDWSQAACTNGIPIANLLGYPSAVNNTREIGHLMANYTVALIKNCEVPLENIKYIGHSLGAHVCGFAAKEVSNLKHGQIQLVIGADPAGPLFSTNTCKERLCISDSKRLVIFHTSVALGMQHPLGDADIYFSGGKTQPGCDVDITCSHSSSIVYISDVLNNTCGFPGVSNGAFTWLSVGPPTNLNSGTTDCIFVTEKILDSNNLIKGQYNVAVDKKSHCTQNTFNCKQQ